MALVNTNLDGSLMLLGRGKVRDVYQIDSDSLLFVATDRISAYDVIMVNGIPDKGKILTRLSEFWFTQVLQDVCPNHLLSSNIDSLPASVSKYKSQLEGRSMVVRKLRVLPIEAIVRGYITGSAWKEYKSSGTVHGIQMPKGLVESDRLPQPIFTPSTKAEAGQHDENIHPDQAASLIGAEYAEEVSKLAVALYTKANQYAESRGIIIADTKFEFGVDEAGKVVLLDEVLTPDSSRFWLASSYKPGRGQDSYDKQFLRDWLTESGNARKEGVEMPADIAQRTKQKYIEAYEKLTGSTWLA